MSAKPAADRGEAKTPSIVRQLNMNDVLGGRGAPIIDNEGNHRFRKIVAGRRAEYFALSRRQAKDRIARQIVTTVRSRGGRFLKKLDDNDQVRSLGVKKGDNVWIELDEDTVLTKVKQALRDKSTEDEEPRPRRRKRVRSGNLVPDEDSESDQPEQKMESSESTSRTQQIQPSISGGRLSHPHHQASPSNVPAAPETAFAASIAPPQAESKFDAINSVGRAGPGQFDTLLQQIREAERFGQRTMTTGNRATTAAAAGILQLPPNSSQVLSHLSTGSLLGDASGMFAGAAAAHPPPDPSSFLPFTVPPQLQLDPLLGAVPGMGLGPSGLGVHETARQALGPSQSTLRALLGVEGRHRVTQQQQQQQPHQPFLQETSKPCEDIILEGLLHPKTPSPVLPMTQILTLSLFEVSLLLVLCDFGLPLLSASPEADAAASSSDDSSNSWTWSSLGEKIVNCSVRPSHGRSAYTSLATLCSANAECVERARVLATALASNSDELGRFAVMFLEKVRGGDSSALRDNVPGASPLLASASAAAATFVSPTNRDSHSRVENFASWLLQQWASRLDILMDGGGRPVAFSSEDMRASRASSSSGGDCKAVATAGALDSQDCERIFSMIAGLSRLRHLFLQYYSDDDDDNAATFIRALTSFPDRTTPFSPRTTWWIDADTPVRDLWLIRNALRIGVSSVVDADATPIGSPLRTLRQSAVTTRQVETRLEKLSSFLHAHFEAQSHDRITTERLTALQLLLG